MEPLQRVEGPSAGFAEAFWRWECQIQEGWVRLVFSWLSAFGVDSHHMDDRRAAMVLALIRTGWLVTFPWDLVRAAERLSDGLYIRAVIQRLKRGRHL